MLTAVPFGLAIGLSLGTLGGGGSVLAVPVLVFVLGLSVHEATTASLLVVTAGALAGGLGHARAGCVCWRHALVFTAAAVPGSVLGTALGDAVDADVLLAGFALVMLGAAAATWRRASAPMDPAKTTPCPPVLAGRDVAAGLIVGTLTGVFGVGGGFLVVPALAVALALALRLAVGTSLVIVTATSVTALVAHLVVRPDLDVRLTVSMAMACVIGAVAGAHLAGRLPQRALGHAFAVLVVAVAAYLLVSAAVLGGPPHG